MANRLLILALSVMLFVPQFAPAQVEAKVAREAAEYVIRKFGKEAAAEGVETMARKIEVLALKHGDEALVAVRRVGPRAIHILEEAGEHGPQMVKLLAKYGDEAIWVVAKPSRMAAFARLGDNAAEAMIKHGEIAEPLLESMGKPAASALQAVSSQNGRRLAMMASDGELARIGQTPELLDVVAKHGNRAMDFIWRNKGSLAVAAGLTAFLANPEPFLDGSKDLAKTLAENVALPLASVPGHLAAQAARNTNWTVVFLAGMAMVGCYLLFRSWRKNMRLKSRGAAV